jgi:hypothetical protein
MAWLSSDHVETPTDTNATVVQQQINGVFCAIRAEMLPRDGMGQPVSCKSAQLIGGWYVLAASQL